MGKTRVCYKSFLRVIGALCVFGIAGYVFFQAVNLRAESATSKEITQEIQKIKSADEPTTIEELVPLDIPDSENGALVYNQAFNLQGKLRDKYKEEWKYFPHDSGVKWNEVPEAEKEKVRNLLLNDPDFTRFYQLLEKASGMKCQFLKRGEYAKGYEMQPPLSTMAGMRSCARMLADRADIRAEKGEIDNALHDCLTGLKISDSLVGEPNLTVSLVGVATDYIALDRMEEIMRKKDAKPETCRLLMEAIARQRNDKIMYRSLLGERLITGLANFRLIKNEFKNNRNNKKWVEDLITELFSETKDSNRIAGIIRKDPVGFLEENQLAYFKTMAKLVAISKRPYFETREIIPGLEKEISEFPAGATMVKLFVSPVGIFALEAKLDAQLGNAEIALACHLYKAIHKDYPVFLKELSPEFLPELPLDPFTGKDYLYRKKDKGFIVYSLGDNLKDDGGVSQNEKKWQGDFDIVWEE